MRAKRRFGQHFLSDPRILGRIAAALDATPDDTILEIGPGRGALTAELLARAGRVVAIERDRDLIPDLRARLPRLELIEGDALDVDWTAAVGGTRPWLLAGNIPYNITSPLLDRALTPPRPARIVFLVQKEVADRIAAAPGAKDYGALSVGVQAIAGVERLFTVPAGAFQPPPKVDSAVIRLTPLASPLVGDADIARFRRLVVGLFGFRRKQLLRALRELTGWSAERVTPLAAVAGLDPVARPEAISPDGFARLACVLVDAGWGGEYPS